MGRGQYHKTTAYKKSVKRGRDSMGDLLGMKGYIETNFLL